MLESEPDLGHSALTHRHADASGAGLCRRARLINTGALAGCKRVLSCVQLFQQALLDYRAGQSRAPEYPGNPPPALTIASLDEVLALV